MHRSASGLRRLAVAATVLLAPTLLASCAAGGGGDDNASPRSTTSTAPTEKTTDPRPAGSSTTTSLAATTTTAVPTTTAAPTTTAPPPDIRSIDLRNGTYRALCPVGVGEVELRPSQGPTQTPDGAVQVEDFDPFFGDMTGDGREDAVVSIGCVFADGGNAYVSSVVLVTAERDGPRQVGPPVDGFEPVLTGSSVVVSRAVFADADPRCCPSTIRYVPLTFQQDHLAEGGGGRPVTDGDSATTAGIGGFEVGRTYAEIAGATGQPVEVSNEVDVGSECVYVSIEGGPADVSGLGDPDRLRSVEVGNPAVRTKSGLGIGSTEAEVYDAFPGRVTARPHTYVQGGNYLDFVPEDTPERIVVFDTDGATVSYFRVGEPGWADAVEGCA